MSTTSEFLTQTKRVRCLIQQCVHSKLQVNAHKVDTEPVFVEIGRGCVLFLCFFKNADESDVDKLVKLILNVKLSETDDQKHVSIDNLPGDLLVIPQATLGGQVKGKSVQYHSNIEKEKGFKLYEKFIELCENKFKENSKWVESGKTIKCGTYGNRQVYSTETNGPYLHLIEF